MLLAYSADSGLAVHGTAWQAALSAAQVEHRLVVIDEADHAVSSSQAQRRLHQEVTEWFEHARSAGEGDHSNPVDRVNVLR
jgi:hypothetical protein